ncbi:MAG: hypothetical protein LYZ70_01550 [Nitrososphaerales archaeon]|nr:hypothetical protein [Nitrososphaerales archaeon]
MSDAKVLNWLLQDNQPSVRYLTLTGLLERPRDDSQVRAAKEALTKRGWAADILAKQRAGGWWVEEGRLYRPKYLSTNWMLLVLSDLGLTREDPRVEKACELWIKRFAKRDGGFGTDDAEVSELCLVGNTARALVKFGYAGHPKVRSAFDWLVQHQKPNGGWHCWGKNGVIDGWEGMNAFAALPRHKWNRSIKRAVEKGAEFYLERELHKQGGRYGPWYRFHYPNHYYYDILVGLEFVTALGFAGDRRLRYAISLLKEKRRRDGRWILDAVHPDVEGSLVKWYSAAISAGKMTPFALEKVGAPSKVVTLKAMTVMMRLGEWAPP